MTVDFRTLRIFSVWDTLSLVLMWSVCLVSTSVKQNNTESKKTGSSRVSPVMEQRFLRYCVRKPRQGPLRRERSRPLHLFLSAEPTQKDVYFLEGKTCTFGSRTKTEKLSLTYFLSSASLALSSQAVRKSLNWETDSCNQTLALRKHHEF